MVCSHIRSIICRTVELIAGPHCSSTCASLPLLQSALHNPIGDPLVLNTPICPLFLVWQPPLRAYLSSAPFRSFQPFVLQDDAEQHELTASSSFCTFFLFSSNCCLVFSNVRCRMARNSSASVVMMCSAPLGTARVRWTPLGRDMIVSLIVGGCVWVVVRGRCGSSEANLKAYLYRFNRLLVVDC